MSDDPKTILSNWRAENLDRYGIFKRRALISNDHGPFKGVNWPDIASQNAYAFLRKRGVNIPWTYDQGFGDNHKVVGLRAGGIGVVFIVEAVGLGEGKIYAAKTLQRFMGCNYLEMPECQQKDIANAFFEEALHWLEMGQHTNIVAVHLLENIIHPESKRNVPFIFSEFMERGDLGDLVSKRGKIDVREIFELGLQICEGLLHAYERGLSAHKDLKPDNVMVGGNGIYKVTDFSAGVMGTPGYMAPEQVAVIKKIKKYEIDHRADQFATSLILHDCFTGNLRQEQRKRIELINSDPERFMKEGLRGYVSSELPPVLKGIITRCLQSKVEDRFAGILELKEELLRAFRKEFQESYRFPEEEKDDSWEWWFDRGNAFRRMNRLESAKRSFRNALKRLVDIQGTEFLQASCLLNLGNIYRNFYQLREAKVLCMDALKLFETIPNAEFEQASSFLSLGNIFLDTAQFQQAETYYVDALKRFRNISGTEMSQAECYNNLGCVCRNTSQLLKAEKFTQTALDLYKGIPGAEIKLAGGLLNLGIIYYISGQFKKAEKIFKDALSRFEVIPGTVKMQADCLLNLGNIYSDSDLFQQALIYFNGALKHYDIIHGAEIARANCIMNIGNVYGRTDQFTEAIIQYNCALNVYNTISGTEIARARCYMNLGIVYSMIQEFSSSREALHTALEICEQCESGTENIRCTCQETLRQLP